MLCPFFDLVQQTSFTDSEYCECGHPLLSLTQAFCFRRCACFIAQNEPTASCLLHSRGRSYDDEPSIIYWNIQLSDLSVLWQKEHCYCKMKRTLYSWVQKYLDTYMFCFYTHHNEIRQSICDQIQTFMSHKNWHFLHFKQSTSINFSVSSLKMLCQAFLPSVLSSVTEIRLGIR